MSLHEVLPGALLFASHFYVEAGALFDPRIPAEGGIEEVARHGRPDRILLSNRHHLRHAEAFADAFGCSIHVQRAGLHEFAHGGPDVRPFGFGDEVAPGVRALEVGALCDEETAFHLRTGPGALLFADALIRGEDGALGFVPDFLMGEEPERVKRGIGAALARLLAEDFDAVLFAHGEPLAAGGKRALEDFLRARALAA
ncbi:MAG: hypothetical protein HZB46_17180 [Solirubrobacterales bacterium]|nr:hypothetical protein [Solirubrobacterales bacterium]